MRDHAAASRAAGRTPTTGVTTIRVSTLKIAKPPPITLVSDDAMKDSIAPAWLLTRSRSLSFTTSEPKLSCRWVDHLVWPSAAAAVTYCGTRPSSRPICARISG